MKIRKLVALLTAALMMLALAAPAFAEGELSEPGVLPIWTGSEPYVLTVLTAPNAQVTDWDDNTFTHWIEDNCNVDLQFEFLPEVEPKQKLNIMITAGEELPDIINYGLSVAEAYTYGEAGALVNLQPYYEGGLAVNADKAVADYPSWNLITNIHKNFRKGMQPQSLLEGHYGNDKFGRWTNKTCEKKLAFLFGFILHYALDRTGHKYVNEMVDKGVASHFTIEAEFDRMLMCMDGYDPLTHRVTEHIHPTLELAENVKQFFPGATTLDMYGTLRMQKFILSFMNLPTRYPRKLWMAVLDRIGMPKFKDLFMSEEPDPRCFETNEVLNRILNDTVDEGVEFVTTLLDRLTGKLEWDDRFNWNFEGHYKGPSAD